MIASSWGSKDSRALRQEGVSLVTETHWAEAGNFFVQEKGKRLPGHPTVPWMPGAGGQKWQQLTLGSR